MREVDSFEEVNEGGEFASNRFYSLGIILEPLRLRQAEPNQSVWRYGYLKSISSHHR